LLRGANCRVLYVAGQPQVVGEREHRTPPTHPPASRFTWDEGMNATFAAKSIGDYVEPDQIKAN